MNEQDAGGQPGQQQMLQVFQQKVGNLELTINALVALLSEADVIDEDELNQKAEEIVQEMQEQQAAAQGGEQLQG